LPGKDPSRHFLRSSADGATRGFRARAESNRKSSSVEIWQSEALSNMRTFRIRMAR
jgi:hypothetical protein